MDKKRRQEEEEELQKMKAKQREKVRPGLKQPEYVLFSKKCPLNHSPTLHLDFNYF